MEGKQEGRRCEVAGTKAEAPRQKNERGIWWLCLNHSLCHLFSFFR